MSQAFDRAAWYTEEGGFFGPAYLEEYDQELPPERTAKDVEFLEHELDLRRGARILDLACGHGRHSVELARRGFAVTGQDINRFFLERAGNAARKADVDLRLVRSDMRQIPFDDEFDIVINMFTAFGYLETDEEDQKVVHQVAKALRRDGRFVLDVINRDRIMRVFREREGWELTDGSVIITERKFDFATSRNHERRLRVYPDGRRREVKIPLRMYSLHELVRLCAESGLQYEKSFGDNDSSPVTFSSMRCIIIARKP